MQALVSFVGDCTDTEVLHDVLELICTLLAPHEATQRPLLACLADLGGVQLFMSLVQREPQSIRILGLRIIAAFVPFPASPSPPLSPRTTGGVKPAYADLAMRQCCPLYMSCSCRVHELTLMCSSNRAWNVSHDPSWKSLYETNLSLFYLIASLSHMELTYQP